MMLDAAHEAYCEAIRIAIKRWDEAKLKADKEYRLTYGYYTVKQLKILAKNHGFKGFHKLKKAQLIDLFSECNEFSQAYYREYCEEAYQAAYKMNQATQLAKVS